MSIKEMKTLAIANEEYEVYDEKARPVENVAHMRAMTNLVAGNVIKTKGYYSENDGGGAIYYITDVQTNSKYQIPLSNELYATLIIKQETSVKQLGAFGNGESHVISSIFSTLEDAQKIYPKADSLENEIDGLAIQTAIDYMPNKIVIPEGTYMVNKTITIAKNNRHITGINKYSTILKWNAENETMIDILKLESTTSRNIVENMGFTSINNSSVISDYALYKIRGISLDGSSYNTLRNLRLLQLYIGIRMAQSWCNNIEDCYVGRCHRGIDSSAGSNVNNIYIKNCQVEYNDVGIYLGEGRTQTLYNCDIENNNTMGVQKTNEGDIQIIGCYFEDKVRIQWGQTYVSNVLIMGCSFFQNPETIEDAYTPIEYHGMKDHTNVSIVNCLFKNLSTLVETHLTPITKQNNNNVTVNPILINNTIYQMAEPNPIYFRGIIISKGKVKNYNERSLKTNYINVSDGDKTLTLSDSKKYRVNLAAEGSASIILPKVEGDDRYINHEFEFLLAGNNNASAEGIFNIKGQDGVTVYGLDKTINKNDIHKIIKCVYIGDFNSVTNWQVIK